MSIRERLEEGPIDRSRVVVLNTNRQADNERLEVINTGLVILRNNQVPALLEELAEVIRFDMPDYPAVNFKDAELFSDGSVRVGIQWHSRIGRHPSSQTYFVPVCNQVLVGVYPSTGDLIVEGGKDKEVLERGPGSYRLYLEDAIVLAYKEPMVVPDTRLRV